MTFLEFMSENLADAQKDALQRSKEATAASRERQREREANRVQSFQQKQELDQRDSDINDRVTDIVKKKLREKGIR